MLLLAIAAVAAAASFDDDYQSVDDTEFSKEIDDEDVDDESLMEDGPMKEDYTAVDDEMFDEDEMTNIPYQEPIFFGRGNSLFVIVFTSSFIYA